MTSPAPASTVEVDRMTPYLWFLFVMLSTATLFDGFDAGMLSFAAPESRRTLEIDLSEWGLINSLIRETLAFARGESSLWVRKVYLQKYFVDLEEQLAQEFRGRGMTVKLYLRDRGIAQFDQHKLQRAVHNLARNALNGAPGPSALVP